MKTTPLPKKWPLPLVFKRDACYRDAQQTVIRTGITFGGGSLGITMGFSQLSLKDKEIVLMALKAAISRQYIDEDDIELVFGVKRDVFDALIEKYPNFSDSERAEDSETVHAIDISLVFFQGMASIKTYQKMFTVPQSELRRVHSVWSENRGIQPIYGD